ncbi:hypothetical protein [Clostridium sp.]|uniref:hypothetical protein n=1 Tax=Clostridium sp. TaxID=1506 RepID=UPI001A5BBA0B|nr:hypothetical protein [Clostridium sp.]MBK5234243.1 hypothetical protein [Clostridium sp.]
MKLMCKCGNIEDIKSDENIETFEFRSCEDDTLVLVCKKCSEVVFINFHAPK